MATSTASGYFNLRPAYRGDITVATSTVDVANNRTLVLITQSVTGTTGPNGSWSFAPYYLTWSYNVNGSTDSGQTEFDFRNYATLTIRNKVQLWVPHNADGTKTITFSAAFGGDSSIGTTSTGNKQLVIPAIPRASTSTFSPSNNFDADSPVTINTNRAASGFTHTLTYTLGSASGTIATGVGASTTWTPPMSLLSQFPNATSRGGTLTTVTFNGATNIGSKTTAFTLRAPASVVPTIDDIELSDHSTVAASVIGGYVQGVSAIDWSIVNDQGAYGSTIASRQVTISGVTQSGSSGTSAILGTPGTISVEARVTDTRGRVATQTKSVNVMAYASPRIDSFIARRSTATGVLNPDGEYIRIDTKTVAASLMVGGVEKNSATRKIRTRLRGDTIWTDKVTSAIPLDATGYTTIGLYPVDQSFDVRMEIADALTGANPSAAQTTVATSFVLMHWARDGIGVGKYWNAGALDVAGFMYQNGNKVLDESSTIPAAKVGPGYPATDVTVGYPGANLSGTAPYIHHNDTTGRTYISTDIGGVGGPGASYMGLSPAEDAGQTTGMWFAHDNATKMRVLKDGHIDTTFLPYAEAAGTMSGASTGYVTVTFPANRFDIAPIVTLQCRSSTGSQVSVGWIDTLTETSMRVRLFTLSGAGIAGTIHWNAVQMRTTSASG